MKRTLIIFSLLAVFYFCVAPTIARPSAPATDFEDRSPHITGFKSANGTRFHYLDWGGEGEVILFLSGLGNTAHIFDGIAPVFTDRYRVLAMTRRGFGQSDIPSSGYDMDTLVEDIHGFLRSFKKLNIQKVILAGHSIAGDEMTGFAAKHPSMVSALIFLDAAYDRVELAALPPDPFPPAPATSDDVKSYDSLRSYYNRALGFWSDALEADMRERLKFTRDGRVYSVTPEFVTDQILTGAPHPDYTRMTAPMLSMYSLDPPVHPRIPPNASESDRKRGQDYWDLLLATKQAQIEKFRQDARGAKVVEMEDTNHYNFIQRQRSVVRNVRAFLAER